MRLRLSSLRVRLLLLVFLTLIPSLAVIIGAGIERRQHDGLAAQADARQLARITAMNYSHFLSEGRQLLSVLPQVAVVRDHVPGVCRRFLVGLLQQHRRFANLGVFTPGGRLACSAQPVHGPVVAADLPYFRKLARSRRFVVGGFEIGRITHMPVLVIAQPTFDPRGRLHSVIFGALSLHWLSEMAARVGLPPGTVLTILDQRGRIMVRYPDPGAWIGRRVTDPALLQALHSDSGDGTTDVRTYDGVRRLVGFARLRSDAGEVNGYIVIGIPAAVAYASARRLLAVNVTVVALVLIVALFLAWLASEALILRKARALVGAARRLAEGDLAARTGLASGRDELSQVAITFDQMAGSLEARAQEVQRHLAEISRLNRIYRVLSAINGALLRVHDADALLQYTCDIAVHQGEFAAAWIGMVSADGERVAAVAHVGPEGSFLQNIVIPLGADLPQGQGCVGPAVREGRHQVCSDTRNDPRMAPWREQLLAMGVGSVAAFPLRVDGRVIGVLGLYAVEPGFFDRHEIRLLEELAADTSLGLDHIEKAHRLEYLANYDPLTNLPNRSLFEDRLAQQLARAGHDGRYVAVVAVEIAEFAQVAETVGRHAGDRALQEVAHYLAGAVREGDTVARVQGGEFGVILADVARVKDLERVVRKLLQGFPGVVPIGREEIYLRLRAGIAIFPADGHEPATLIEHARLALRAPGIEAEGPSFTFYAPEINRAIRHRRRLEQVLRHALERGELRLHYQPVVEIGSGRIIGAEALARWHSPELGAVAPAEFIPIAEATGLIVPLGAWVLETACRQAVAWHTQGHTDCRIAVNVSVRQLRQPGFTERVEAILGRCGLAPKAMPMAVEITESMLMDDIQSSVTILEQLKRLGLHIYVDDFGTGHSSLAYLQRLPVDVLKIDQSFVHNLATAEQSVGIAKSVIDLARFLRLKVIAEGVETGEQLAVLRDLGCDAVQGYLYSPPVPAETFAQLLQTPRPFKV